MRKILFSLALLSAVYTQAQLNESFTDGDFTTGVHVWSGTTTTWGVVTNSDVAAGATGSFTLRLAATLGTSATEYLSTQILGSWGTSGQTWGFWLGRRAQAATIENQSYVWLWANEADITSATVDGYRIRFGDNTGGDDIFLESVTNGTATTVITSSGSVPNGLTDIGFMVRVTRSSGGEWNLFTSTLPTTSGTGAIATDLVNAANTSVAQGGVTNTTFTDFTDGFVAIAALHSTSAIPIVGAEFDQIRLSFSSSSPLPVKFENISGYEKQSGIQIDWMVYSENNLSRYEIERSADGKTFNTVGQVAALNATTEAKYGWFDATPLAGVNFYRLKNIDVDAKFGYSSIIKVNLDKANKVISIYPNPVRGGHVSFQSSDLARGNYTVRIFNNSGQQLYSQNFIHNGGAISKTIQLPQSIQPGMYALQIENDGSKVMSKAFMVQ